VQIPASPPGLVRGEAPELSDDLVFLVTPAVEDDASLLEDVDAFGDPERLVDVLLDEQHGRLEARRGGRLRRAGEPGHERLR